MEGDDKNKMRKYILFNGVRIGILKLTKIEDDIPFVIIEINKWDDSVALDPDKDTEEMIKNITDLAEDVLKLDPTLLNFTVRLVFSQDVFAAGILSDYMYTKMITSNINPLIARQWIPEVSDFEEQYIMEYLAQSRVLKPSKSGAENMDIYNRINDEYGFDFDELSSIERWIRYNKATVRTLNEQEPDSYIANVLNIAYSSSKRPPSSMSIIAQTLGKIKIVKLDKPNHSGRPVVVSVGNNRNVTIIPVIRYSMTAYSSGYYKESGKVGRSDKYCGTFYYWEPQSHIYLIMGQSIYFTNKIIALLTLAPKNLYAGDLVLKFVVMAIDHNMANPDLDDFFDQRDAMIKLLSAEPDHPITTPYFTFDSNFNKEQKYIGNIFYALEDEIDQLLCIEARNKGYDTIIFSKMPGSRRIVTEILDTRSREMSLNNLVWEAS
jgi:hypothetical protein